MNHFSFNRFSFLMSLAFITGIIGFTALAHSSDKDIEKAYQRIERYRSMQNSTQLDQGMGQDNGFGTTSVPCMVQVTSKHYINANQVKFVRTRLGSSEGMSGVVWVFGSGPVVFLPTSHPQTEIQRYLNIVRERCNG